MTDIVHPPETLEGWYALHQVLRVKPGSDAGYRDTVRALASRVSEIGKGLESGWSALAELTTTPGEILLLHFRATFDDLAAARSRLREDPAFAGVEEVFSMVSVTEAGLYHLTAELARAAAERGGRVGDDVYQRDLARRREAERASEHVQRRLFPPIPAEMPYVCFYRCRSGVKSDTTGTRCCWTCGAG